MEDTKKPMATMATVTLQALLDKMFELHNAVLSMEDDNNKKPIMTPEQLKAFHDKLSEWDEHDSAALSGAVVAYRGYM